jgi:hypothetical protein
MATAARFPIKFDSAYAVLSRALLISPAHSYVEVAGNEVTVQMGWAFRAKFDRSRVQATSLTQRAPISRGVHGWAGRWLVNGSGDGILAIDLEPRQRAHVIGWPVRLRQLLVSVADPVALRTALAA